MADWFNYLTSLGMSPLADVAQGHCQAYLAVASRGNADPDRRLSPSTITAWIRATQVLERHVIEDHRAAGIPAPRLAGFGPGPAAAGRLGPADPLLHLAWHPVVAVGQRRVLETLRPELEKWVQQCGIAQPWCRDAALIGSSLDRVGYVG